MLEKIKSQIRKLAREAVSKVEIELSTKSGKEKKEAAIGYIITNLPITPFLKPVIKPILSKFIDDAVEFAVTFMKTKGQEG
ncbi:MAG: hypothetical protein LKG27_05575 [Clostridiaceae bacterium]|jgi:hypothetical protein|nr:hypothetical protein [Clostridiaceae bacterium]